MDPVEIDEATKQCAQGSTTSPRLLQLGDWRVLLYGCPPVADRIVNRFTDSFPEFVSQCNGAEVRVLAVVGAPVPDDLAPPKCLSEESALAWMRFRRAWTALYGRSYQNRAVESRESMESGASVFTWSPSAGEEIRDDFSPESAEGDNFLVLVIEKPGADSHLKMLGYCILGASQWHIMHGGFCLHSGAVARGGDGFLFLGQSEAGKTTVAQLSASLGHAALGDDLNFVTRGLCNDYRLAAAPSPARTATSYSMNRPRLRGVFTLVQDDRDYLVSRPPRLVARVLFESFTRETPYMQKLPSEAIGLAFRTICDVARTVPGYELHFRKSPDFWKLIDKEFPPEE